jgi:hypothetical protein
MFLFVEIFFLYFIVALKFCLLSNVFCGYFIFLLFTFFFIIHIDFQIQAQKAYKYNRTIKITKQSKCISKISRMHRKERSFQLSYRI